MEADGREEIGDWKLEEADMAPKMWEVRNPRLLVHFNPFDEKFKEEFLIRDAQVIASGQSFQGGN